MPEQPTRRPIETIGEKYENLLHKAMNKLREFREETGPALHKSIDIVSNELAEAEELSLDEARELAASLKRDLLHAAHHLKENKDELKSWLGFDIAYIEETLLNAFLDAADKTTVQLAELQSHALTAEYHTGEVVGISTLRCDNCGAILHFHKPGHIPPCPKCKHTVFHRTTAAQE